MSPGATVMPNCASVSMTMSWTASSSSGSAAWRSSVFERIEQIERRQLVVLAGDRGHRSGVLDFLLLRAAAVGAPTRRKSSARGRAGSMGSAGGSGVIGSGSGRSGSIAAFAVRQLCPPGVRLARGFLGGLCASRRRTGAIGATSRFLRSGGDAFAARALLQPRQRSGREPANSRPCRISRTGSSPVSSTRLMV